MLVLLSLILPAASAQPAPPLVVGGDRDFPPYEFLDKRGRPTGFNVELIQAIAQVMDLDVAFRLDTWDRAVAALNAGRVDILPLAVAPDRYPFALYTEPYTLLYFEAFARRNTAPLHGLDALSGHRIIVRRDSLAHRYLLDNGQNVQVEAVDSEPDALRLLASGAHDYALVSRSGGLLTLRKYRLSNLVSTGPPLLPHGYGLAVAGNDEALREQLNQGLAILKANGRYNELHERWFSELYSDTLSMGEVLRYAALVLGPLLLITIAALVWSWLLKTRVAERTRALRRELAERRQAEAALKDSETRFRDFTEAVSDWIWEMDANFRFTFLSERWEELTGIKREQILGRTRWDVSAPDANREKWRRHRETLEAHKPFRDFIYRSAPTDQAGQAHYLKTSGKPIYDARGRFIGYRGTGTDMTEQMEAELALRESQRTLETLMDNLPGMAYRAGNDPDRTLEFVSPGAIGLTGYLPAQLIRNTEQSFTGLIHMEDRQSVWDRIQTALAARRPYQITYRIRTRQGEGKWVWEQGRGVLNADGELQALEGLVLDITEQMQAERERNRLRLYLKNIIDSMPSILVGVDPQGRITEWNLPAEQRSGLTREQAQGRFFGEVFPELQQQMEQVRRSIEQGRPIKTPRLVTRNGTDAQYADVMVYPLVSNGAMGAVIRVDDVTARVRIEEMMVQTEKMLSVGGLAAGMAHEINNPLGTILQGAQNIQRRLSPDLPKNHQVAEQVGVELGLVRRYLEERSILRFVEGIREAGARAAKIVSDMLAFSRSSESRFTPVHLAEILDMVIRLAASDYDLKKRYDFKQVHIERDYDPELGPVMCDKTQIEQVILNLVKNAAQAMAGHVPKPTILLRTRREPHHARIEVIDNGPGIDDTTRKRVFEPFFTTKEVGVGTGLGLSVSYFIVTEQHKGTLTVSSSPGEGARFVIRLPLSHEARPSP